MVLKKIVSSAFRRDIGRMGSKLLTVKEVAVLGAVIEAACSGRIVA